MTIFSMLKTTIVNLFSKPATILYPFVQKTVYDATRGKIGIEVEKCIFCSLCQKKCPTAAISVLKSESSWTIERLRCITCGACVDACPKKCLIMTHERSEPVLGSSSKKDTYTKK